MRDVVGVSVVELDADGPLYPKVLTMTANRYRKVYETIMLFRAMNPTGFTLMGYPWMFGFTGDTAATEVPVFRPLPDEPPIDLPDPHDIPELLAAAPGRGLRLRAGGHRGGHLGLPAGRAGGTGRAAAPAEPRVDVAAPDPAPPPEPGRAGRPRPGRAVPRR